MADFSSLPLSVREEVQNYCRSSEHLLASVAMPNNPPLTQEELELIEYYMCEFTDTLVPQAREMLSLLAEKSKTRKSHVDGDGDGA